MKKILLCLMIISASGLYSQVSTTILDQNQARATLEDEGILFMNSDSAVAGYEIPKGGGISSIFSSSFWFGGTDENGILRLAATRYNSGHDFFSGPVSSNGMYNDPAFIAAYDNAIWNVTKAEIDYHIQNYLQPGYVIPNSLMNWPGNGIASLGVAQNLAPYNDVNGDNIYNPANGDFPVIRGDAASYIILNDMASIHTETGGEKMGIEIHIMAYQYSSSNFIDSTTFLNVRVFNRGDHEYANFKTSLFMDGDLGSYNDDYIGCDSSKNMMFVYNGIPLDENGYGANPPSLGIVSLNNPMSSSGYYHSNASYPYTDPSTASQYWNFMNGRWADGSGWYYGGMGYAGSVGVTITPTNYLFSGKPFQGLQWSEEYNNNMSGDRRSFMTVDSIELNSGQESCFDFAVIFSHGSDYEGNVNYIYQLADSVKVFYDNQLDYNCSQYILGLDEMINNGISVYPNPSSSLLNLKVTEDQIGENYYLTDFTGKIIKQGIISNENSTISVEDLSEGFYTLVLAGGMSKTIVKRD